MFYVLFNYQTWRLYNEERALEVMDPTLEGSYSSEEALRVIKIGLLCTQGAAALRPSMSRVVSMLTSEREHLSSPTRPVFIDLDREDQLSWVKVKTGCRAFISLLCMI
jgi:hypothetical protein